MIILDNVNRKFQLVLVSPKDTLDCPFIISYVDVSATAYTPGSTNGSTNGTTPVDALSAPGASTQRQIKFISLRNSDTASISLKLRYNDNSTLIDFFTATIPINSHLVYSDGEGFRVFDSSGTLMEGSSGTVTNVSIVSVNGISGSVATSTTTPAISLALGNITPTSISASGTITGSNLSGTNTGNQTITLTGAVTGSGTSSFSTTLATVAEAYGGTNQTTYTKGDIIHATATNTLGKLAIGSIGQFPAANSTGVLSPRDIIDISNQFYLYQEFGGISSNASTGTPPGWVVANSGAGAVTASTALLANGASAAMPGTVVMYAGTTATGYTTMGGDPRDALQIIGGGTVSYETVIKILNLSKAGDRYIIFAGFAPSATTTAVPTKGVYFSYSDDASSGNWALNSAAASSTTTRDTGIPATTGIVRLGFTINAAGTSIQAYINGSAVGAPITTNIMAANIGIAPFYQIRNTAYTSQSNLFLVSVFKLLINLTTPR